MIEREPEREPDYSVGNIVDGNVSHSMIENEKTI